MDQGNREFEGKNLDVAIWKASQELQIPVEQLRYQVVSRGKRGARGESLEPARIRVISGESAAEPVAASPAPPVERPRPEPERPAPPASAVEEEAEEEEPEEEPIEEEDEEDLDEEDEEEPEEEEEEDLERDDEEDEEDDEDLEDVLSSPAPVFEEDDPIEEARRARQERGAPSEPRPEPPSRPERPERPDRAATRPVRPERRERPERPARPAPPPRAERVAEAEDRGAADAGGEAGAPPALEDLEGGLERAQQILPDLLRNLDFDLEARYEMEEDHVYVSLEGADGDYLLDDRAEGLNALQYLLNKMVYRGGPTRIVVDANGYRKGRQEEIVARAIELARQVRESGEARSVGTLNPFERRLVHMALRDDPEVRTVSHGDSFMKRLEIAPKGSADSDRPPRFPAGWDRDGSGARRGHEGGAHRRGRGRGRGRH